jgi:uncharacterized damage-inducible protein DinB
MHAPSQEFVSTYCAMMLDGVTREMETTKKVIAAVPHNKHDYRPDPHSRTAFDLAWHIANSDVEFLDGIADMKFNFSGAEPANKPKTIDELVAWYDREMKRGIARVRAMSPAQQATVVDFVGMFQMPAAFYLAFLNNHCIHHRGQLAAYLRPMGGKVPSIYGGSHDEPFQMPAQKTGAA